MRTPVDKYFELPASERWKDLEDRDKEWDQMDDVRSFFGSTLRVIVYHWRDGIMVEEDEDDE